MTPLEALDVALLEAEDDYTSSILAALDALGFTVARTQDARDGEALRLLEAVSDTNHYIEVDSPIDDMGWDVSVVSIYPGYPRLADVSASTIAAAADACREVIEATR